MVAALDHTRTGEIFDLYWDYEDRGAVAEKLYSDYASGFGVFRRWIGKLGNARALAVQFDRITGSEQSRRMSLEERYGEAKPGGTEKQPGDKQPAGSAASQIITDGSHIKDGKLKPNVTYTTGEYNYIYKTNGEGLIVHVSVPLLFLKKHIGRLQNAKNTLGKLAGDHAGHLIADLFGGSPQLDNLVSQAGRVNLSEYKSMENKWARALRRGDTVSVEISIEYEEGSSRPSRFIIEYTINGKVYNKKICNS